MPIPEKGSAKQCSNYHTIALISHASKVMLKILQARLQQYVNQELPGVQAGFRKGRRTRDQIADIHWIIERAREFQENIYFSFTKLKPWTMWNTTTVENSERDGNTRPPYLPPEKPVCFCKEATVRTGYGTKDWFKIGEGVCQGCILSPCSFNLYAEYIMRNARLDEAQAGIKISRRNINNLR